MPGKISEKFIDELLTRVDIVDVIDARVPLRKAGKDFKACCPFHEEKTPSFTVSQTKQFYHCFGCGQHGSAIGFLMEYERMSFPEAVTELANRVGMEVPRDSRPGPDQPGEQTAGLLEILQQADRYYRRQLREHPKAQEAIDYLKKRGLSGQICADFGLGYAPDGWDNLSRALGSKPADQQSLITAGLAVKKDNGGLYDRFRQRVMFPIQDYRGRLVGFGGRVLGEGEPKYLNSPETPLFHKGRELYGLFRAREAIRRENCVLVVEGYMDVVALAQFGVDNVVATLGTATTREHLERLFRFTTEVAFCFDGDRAGREAAWRALENALPAVHEGRQVSFLFLPEGDDPDTLVRREGREGFLARLAEALPLPDYLFQHLGAQVDLNRLDGRARLVELARPLLSNLSPGVLQEMMWQRLGEISRLDPQNLTSLLKKQANPMAKPGRRPPPARGQQTLSLVRRVVTLVLQNPELARHVPDPERFLALERPGIDLWVALIKLLHAQPQLKTGSLIEHFRDSEHQQSLAKLAAWQHPLAEADMDGEYQDLVQQLRRDLNRQATERLYSKERLGGLSPEEKTELKRLLAEKLALVGTGPARE